jgi:ribonuclease P protein component
MISQKYRFHGHGSLNYLHRNGKTGRAAHLVIKFVPNQKRQLPRFAVVVSKKIFKSAVKRNRVRRRIFEIIRLNIRPDSPSVDAMINVYSGAVLDMPPAELKAETEGLLKSAGFVVK